MAQDQGTQFEWCVLHTAYSRLTNPEVLSSTQLKTKEKALTNWDKANSTVRNHAKNVIDKLAPSSTNESLKFYYKPGLYLFLSFYLTYEDFFLIQTLKKRGFFYLIS